MLTIHHITSQLQSQTLADASTVTSNPVSSTAVINSSQDENAAKMRHHSEPHPPGALHNSDTTKKVKIITFQEGIHKDMALTSLLISQQASDTSVNSSSSINTSWDCANSNPPNKRQCRSMSIPNDGELHTRWLQNQARSRLHRPLAVRPGSGGSRNKSHSHRSSQVRLPPVWSSLAPSDGSTPPESPRSRPSSASSGYFDSPLTSLSNLNKHRCESLQTLPSMSNTEQQVNHRHHSGGAISHPSSSVSTSRGKGSVASAKSMPSVAAVDNSSHLSPHKQRLLRCQSQPCVIHERRCGVKRRITDNDNRPSINFNKMKETAFGGDVNCSTSSIALNRLTSPLNIRPVARYGPILQTIASSPQDMTYISTLTSSSNGTAASPPKLVTPTINPFSPAKFSLAAAGMDSLTDRGEESDSGCSTTDEELCDITNKMNTTTARGDHSDSLSVTAATCNHKVSHSSGSSSGCPCTFDDDSGHNIMFVMEPTQDSELDLDEIENN